MSKFYTTRQVADLLGVSAPTVIKWVEKGSLLAHRTPGGHRRVSHEALRNFSESCGHVLGGAPVQEVSHPGRVCVLVVDPELDFADTVAEYLSMQGDVDVVQAIEPLDVGFAIGAHKPMVVLFDVDSPGIQMRDLGRLMMSHCRSSRLLVLTSISDVKVERMALELDGCELIQKPVKLDRLWKLICAV